MSIIDYFIHNIIHYDLYAILIDISPEAEHFICIHNAMISVYVNLICFFVLIWTFYFPKGNQNNNLAGKFMFVLPPKKLMLDTTELKYER